MTITNFRRCHSVDRRQKQCRFISIPTMPSSTSSSSPPSSSSSSSSRCCLICILFGLCLAFIVILAAVVIYHLHSSDSRSRTASGMYYPLQLTAKKRQLPDFVNDNIDPCQHFYEFVCDKLTQKKNLETFINEEFQDKWKYIQQEIHEKLMTTDIQEFNENDHISSIYRVYQLCEKQSPDLLIDELERYFDNISQQEPYRSYLTLFNQTYILKVTLNSSIFLHPNPFFKIISTLNYSMINRVNHRPLPSVMSIFPNEKILNQTALNDLIQFENDYLKILSEEDNLIKSYEHEYNQDSLIIKRILSHTNYNQCHSSLTSNITNGLEKLIHLLNHFLYSHLQNFDRKSIDKQIRILDKITDNHTLVEHLQRIRTDLKTIEQIVLINNTNTSCIIHLLDQLLDKRIQSNELISIINLYSFNQTINEYFISNNWPFLIMLYQKLLNKTSIYTLVNYAFYDYYRQFIYPYYQPHVHQINYTYINHYREFYGYTYQTNYSNLSCQVRSCFDILNCYHPSLLNHLLDNQNQKLINQTNNLVKNLISNFRLLIDQSDHLYTHEKKQINNELNQIQISVGHYDSHSIDNIPSLSNHSLSYLEYIKILSSIEYDKEERSYFIEPIYYPLNHTLFIPYGFLSLPNNSIEYHIIKLLLKIIRLTHESNPYNIECLLKSSDDEQDSQNITKIPSNDEQFVYLLLRSKFLSEHKIILDEYLWPFMSASSLMKRFLIDYTATNYCRNINGYNFYKNNTYFIDDVHLVFYCQQAVLIKQSKCTVT